jgi:DNA-binding response OmpR family regulator
VSTTIFIVDSSPAVRRIVEQISTPQGYEVVGFSDGPTALEAARRHTPNLIIVDYHLDNITFSGFCKELRKHDNLADTHIVSLVNPADGPDESRLRSLGVKAFLRKPFQSEHLVDLIKDLHENQEGNGAAHTSQRRAWPPTFSATDTEDEEEFSDVSAHHDDPLEPEDPTIPDLPAASREPAVGEQTRTRTSRNDNVADETTTAGNQSDQTDASRTEPRRRDPHPESIAKEVAAQLPDLVAKSVRAQLPEALHSDRLKGTLGEALREILPPFVQEQLQRTIRQTLSEMVEPMVQEVVDRICREAVESGIRKHLPDAVREQLGSLDLLIKEELRQVGERQLRCMVEEATEQLIPTHLQEAVQRIVPEIAETQVKEEIRKLTAEP